MTTSEQLQISVVSAGLVLLLQSAFTLAALLYVTLDKVRKKQDNKPNWFTFLLFMSKGKQINNHEHTMPRHDILHHELQAFAGIAIVIFGIFWFA